MNFIRKHKVEIILWFFITVYAVYFSYFSILRYKTLYASYFDLGIMHQTVYNTYRALITGDMNRILELTNPFGGEQITRMAIHNDMFLGLISPLYFIYSGPETLLILQTLVTAFGALAIYKIGLRVLNKVKYPKIVSLILAVSYLFYPALERSNQFDFHSVTLATVFILFMFYYWIENKYKLSFFFLILTLLTKEQVGLTTLFLGIYVFYIDVIKNKKSWHYPLLVTAISVFWFLLSMYVIIPGFRGESHFAIKYYGDFGGSPLQIFIGILKNPASIFKYIFNDGTKQYLIKILAPVGYLSLVSPLTLLIALPEFAINLLSKSANMRNIYYHYTAVITPFVFISTIYGVDKILRKFPKLTLFIIGFIILTGGYYAYIFGPLPFAKMKAIHPFVYPQKEAMLVSDWSEKLKDERLKISSTGQLAPFFTSRRYFYTFSKYYYLADYIVIRRGEIYNYPEHDTLIPVYENLIKDSRFIRILKQNNFEVYRSVGIK